MDSKRAASETDDGVDAKRINTTEDQDKFEEEGNTQSLDKQVAPCNGCTPSLESFMFQPTPPGSQLLPWCQTSENDLDLEKTASGSKKTDISQVKISRREQAKARREDTMKALALERELTVKPDQGSASAVLLIRFPDPEITVPMLADLSKEIRDVVMPSSVAPRYCLVHLKSGADVEATIADINKVRFGTGYLQAEHKHFSDEEQAEFIDPCSLYVSNIPFNMTTSAIKAYFANALRVDIGVLKREKRARYAFVRYASPEATTVAFRELVSCPLNSRTLTVRYRRLKKRTGLPIVQCTSSIVAMTLPNGGGAGGDDDNADCKVISPPPVESITISDSDNCSDSSGDGKDRRTSKTKSSEQDEIQKLKRQMAEYGAIIKNLQLRQDYLGDTFSSGLLPKTEPCANPSAYIPVLGSHAVHLMRDIKKERAYLGIPDEAVTEPSPAQKPGPLDNMTEKEDQQQVKSFARRRQSAKETAEKKTKASQNKDDRLAELYAQLETDPDP